MSTSELGEPARDENRRSGVNDRRSAEAPFSDLINRWLDEGDRISEVARTVAAQPKERRVLELFRELRAKADRHRFVVVIGAVALSAIAILAMRAFSHAVLKADNTVAAEPARPVPVAVVATARPTPAAAASPLSADPSVPAADPPAPAAAASAPAADPPGPAAAASAPAADPHGPAAAASAPAADPPGPAAAASAPAADPPAPVAPSAHPPASPLPTPRAQPESTATAAEPEPAPSAPARVASSAPAPAPVASSAPAPAPVASSAPAADPPVSEHPAVPVTARPAPAPRRPPLPAKTAAVDTRTPLEACQSAIRWERVQDALVSCDKLTRESPKSADAVVLLAHANLLAGRDGETLRLARRASAIDPKCAEAYLLIGNVEQAAGRTPSARTAYEAYLHAAPRGAHAAEVRAILKSLF
jgi:hypothetical protein